MNIQAEKLELIKRIAEVNNRKIIEMLKAILIPDAKIRPDETALILSKPELTKKIKEARKEINDGKGVKVAVNNLWEAS